MYINNLTYKIIELLGCRRNSSEIFLKKSTILNVGNFERGIKYTKTSLKIQLFNNH